MSRTLAERATDPAWWLEQGLHVLIGGAAAAATAVGSAILAAVLAALWLAVVREFDQRPVHSWGDLLVDVLFTVVGGLSVGCLVWAVF